MSYLLKHVSYQELKDFENINSSVKQTNIEKVNEVIDALTPLIVQLSTMDDLIKPDDSIFTFAKRTNHDEKYDIRHVIRHAFERFSYHQLLEYFRILHTKLKSDRVLITKEDWSAFTRKALWLPFGEETTNVGELQLDSSKFHTAVASATHAAQNIIDAIQQQHQTMEMDEEVDRVTSFFDPNMVKLDEASAQCVFVYDESRSPPFVKAELGHRYDLSLLACATQVGMVPVRQLSMHIAPNGILQLNPANIVNARFALTKHSPDHAKCVVLTIPTTPTTAPISLVASLESGGQSDPICLYVMPESGMPSMKYHTNIVFCPLVCGVNCECQATDSNNQLILIDPEQMTMQFLHTLDSVHITGDLQIPACPTERLIAARVNIPEGFSEPVCRLLDDLNTVFPPPDNPLVEPDKYGLFRLPFVYEINVPARTCTRTPMNYEEITKIDTEGGLTYLTFEEHARFIQPHESLLVQNMLFQMMFIYEQRGENFRTSCPPHKMVFDFYIRRNSGQVAFHYDTTPLFQVSTLSLLFSMPQGMLRPGPYIAPLPVHITPHGAVMPMDPAYGLPPGVCTFMVKRGTCVMANNHVVTHSTPGMRQLIERGEQDVPFMSLDPSSSRRFNFPFMHIPDEFQTMMTESVKVRRSFLRMWHVNVKPEINPVFFGQPQLLCSQEVFSAILEHSIASQEAWFATEKCTCIRLTSANPMEMRSVVQGKASGMLGGRQSAMHTQSNRTSSSKSKSLRVVMQSNTKHMQQGMQNKDKLRARASTLSVMRKKIKSKLAQLNTICKDAKQNVIFVNNSKHKLRSKSRSDMKTRRSSNPRSSRKSSTRRVKSAP